MAGDWIKWVKGHSKRAEVLEMAHALKTDRRIVACACMELWEWADTETADGHIRGGSPEFVDSLVGLSGFARAIEAVGWLRSTEQGITLTRWDRHNSESAKRRAQNNDAQRRGRATKQSVPPERQRKPVSCSEHDIQHDGMLTREEKTRPEQKREERKPDSTPLEALTAIGVGEPSRSGLANAPGITAGLVWSEWDSVLEGKTNNPKGVLVSRLKKKLNATIPKAKSVTAELNRLNALIAQRTA